METGPAVGGQCCAHQILSAGLHSDALGLSRGSAGRAGAAQPMGVAGWRLPHTSSKAKCVLCPSSDFPWEAQRCWEGRVCYWECSGFGFVCHPGEAGAGPQQLSPLAVV